MKTKVLALCAAVMALVACKTGNGDVTPPTPTPGDVKLVVASTQYAVEEGKTVQIEATATPAGTVITYSSLDATIASVDAAGLVTGVKVGNTIVKVQAGDQKANVIINVTQQGGPQPGEKPHLLGSKIWPFYLDNEIFDANPDKVVYSFRINNETRFWDWWEGTYVGGGGTGMNYFQTNAAGGFMSVAPAGGDKTWSGSAFRITAAGLEDKAAMVALVEAIKAEPEKYHLHMAIKSTNVNGKHYFTLFGLGAGNTTGLKWCVGEGYEAESNGHFDINYDGSWNVIDFKFDRYAAALEQFVAPAEDKGINYFTFGSGSDTNNVLNMDAIYIYKE